MHIIFRFIHFDLCIKSRGTFFATVYHQIPKYKSVYISPLLICKAKIYPFVCTVKDVLVWLSTTAEPMSFTYVFNLFHLYQTGLRDGLTGAM